MAFLVAATYFWQHRTRLPAAQLDAAPAADVLAPRESIRSAPGVLRGLVTTSDAQGVDAATVSASAVGSDAPPHLTTTDAKGTFHFAQLTPGHYWITAAAPGLVPVAEQIEIRSGQTAALELSLEQGGSRVAGHVRDFESGVIAGALILARTLDGSPVAATASGNGGAYTLSLPAGAHRLLATAHGYGERERTITVDDRALKVDFSLFPAGRLEGSVQRRDGAPVSGVQVLAVPEQPHAIPPEPVTTDDRGAFALQQLGPATYSLRAFGPGVGSIGETVIPVGIGETVTGVILLVDDAHDIEGRVVASSSRDPIRNVHVEARDAQGRRTPATSPSDERGRFRIQGLTAGTHLVVAEPGPGVSRPATLQVEVQDSRTDLVLEVDTGATVAGRVRPAGPADVSLRAHVDSVSLDQMAGAMLAESRLRTRADEAGRFELHNVPAGSWEVIARREHLEGSTAVDVGHPDARDLLVELRESARLCGTLLDTRGAAVSGARVLLSPSTLSRAPAATIARSFRHDLQQLGVMTGEDGSFCTEPMAPGPYLPFAIGQTGMLLWSDRHLTASGQLQQVALGPGTREGFVFEVRASDGRIDGVVLDPADAPVADVFVTAQLISSFGGDITLPWASHVVPEPPAVTGIDGSFAISGLRPGTYELSATTVDGRELAPPTRATSGEQVTLRLSAAGTLTGTMPGARGACTVSIRGPTERSLTVAGPDCPFTIDRLRPGTYPITADTPALVGSAEAPVEAGDTARVTLEAERRGAVRGRLLNRDGTPADRAPILLLGPAANPTAVALQLAGGAVPRSAPDGHFQLDRLAPGDYVLTSFAADRIELTLSHPFSLAAGQSLDLGALTLHD